MENVTDLAIREWVLELQIGEKSPNTVKVYDAAARSYLASCNGIVTKATIRQWQAGLSKRSAATRRSYAVAVRVWLRWLAAEGIVAEDLGQSVKLPQRKEMLVTPLKPKQLQALTEACAGHLRDRAIVSLLASSGLRISECASVLVKCIDLKDRTVEVCGKGSRWRTVPFDPAAALAIAKYMRTERKQSPYADCEELWLGVRGPIGAAAIDRMLRRRAAEAGLDGIHAHLLRHTFASRWLAAGGSEQGLMSAAGWTSRSMLDHYTKAEAGSRAVAEYKRIWR